MSKESTTLPTLASLDQVKMSGTYYVGGEVVERTGYPMGLGIEFTDNVYDEFGALLYVRVATAMTHGGMLVWITVPDHPGKKELAEKP